MNKITLKVTVLDELGLEHTLNVNVSSKLTIDRLSEHLHRELIGGLLDTIKIVKILHIKLV